MVARMSAVRTERLERRKRRHEAILEGLYDLLEQMTENDVQSYAIGSRNVSRYKSVGEVREAIAAEERFLDEIDAQLAGGCSRKAVSVLPRDL